MIVPGIAKMPTHASEVAIVSLSGMPTSAENAGTMRMPPPMPSRPESAPARDADQRRAPPVRRAALGDVIVGTCSGTRCGTP